MIIARKYKLKVIEDNAESIGGKYKGKRLGAIGDISTLSFYANKIITCGEGGAVLTNSKKIADRSYLLRDHGWLKTSDPIKRYIHLDLGYNYRMTNMQAAVGYSQLQIISKILKKRKKMLSTYTKFLSKIDKIKMRTYQNWCSPVNWLVTITIIQKNLRNKLLKFLNKSGIDARAMIKPVHQAYHFKKRFNRNNFKNSVYISNNSIHLPSFSHINAQEIRFICRKIEFFFSSKRRSN